MLGTVTGTALNLIGVDPIRLLVLVAVINGVAAAPFLVPVMLIANDRLIMGEFANGRLARVLGWSTAGLITAAAMLLFGFGGGGGLF